LLLISSSAFSSPLIFIFIADELFHFRPSTRFDAASLHHFGFGISSL
jgi:hypothetical protein